MQTSPQDSSRDSSAADSVILQSVDLLHPLPVREIFPATARLEIDIGCGKGRFLMARALQHPGANFLGIDRQISRQIGRAHV